LILENLIEKSVRFFFVNMHGMKHRENKLADLGAAEPANCPWGAATK
jgi:hypothetical protein